MTFTHGTLFSHEVSGSLRGFTLCGVGGAGRFCFCLAGGGLFDLSGGFLLFVLTGGFFITFCALRQMRFLHSRMPRLLRGVRRWRESECCKQ